MRFFSSISLVTIFWSLQILLLLFKFCLKKLKLIIAQSYVFSITSLENRKNTFGLRNSVSAYMHSCTFCIYANKKRFIGTACPSSSLSPRSISSAIELIPTKFRSKVLLNLGVLTWSQNFPSRLVTSTIGSLVLALKGSILLSTEYFFFRAH